MGKSKKTNAMRILEQNNIAFDVITYDISDDLIDGVSVAAKVGKSVDIVFKTLVTVGQSKSIYVYVIPVDKELDLKKAAKVVGEKKIELTPVKDLQKLTGYIRGGCSPVGMKKKYATYIHDSIAGTDEIIVSAGKKGAQIVVNPEALAKVTDASFEDLIQA